ncbi:hypothetical protein LTR12_000866 [Friedmanniomyces endolithicus]|nr:hypothetical protein LTR12_000866 [Friedmanniomyces endolithicus]
MDAEELDGEGRRDIHASSLKGALMALIFKCLTSRYTRRLVPRSGSVLFISPRVCIKSTYWTRLAEADAMDFVRRNTSVPVPKVYFACEHKGRTYIVMERINGDMVANQWYHRSEASKRNILHQLQGMVEEFRGIPRPAGVGVANINQGPIFDPRLPTDSYWGPFGSVAEFHRALVDQQDIGSVSNDDKFQDLRQLASFYDQPWPDLVFTHGDLSSLNILCRGDEVVGIIDWETAGWFPPYWEYTTAWNVNPRNTFWQKEVGKFLTPLPHALKMDTIREKYFGYCGYQGA